MLILPQKAAMNILLIGSGGREHAMAMKIVESPRCDRLFIAPGNAGTAQTGENVSLNVSDHAAVERFCREHAVGMIVVGPEQPLADGIADHFAGSEILLLGPRRAAAELESSKHFAKEFMKRHGIPTASYRAFVKGEEIEAEAFIRGMQAPYVIKASGLAAGKGVIITVDTDEAVAVTREMLSGAAFGESGETVVIEQFLDGIELSVFVLTDGRDYVMLPSAKDYKRIGEGDTGPNTGGMGAVSPVPFADESFMEKIRLQVVEPTIRGLQEENIPYCGFIFFGLIRVKGEPFVIEYNVRMGDPETEVVFPLIESDVVELFEAACKGELAGKSLQARDSACTTVFLVSGGYPGNYAKGKVISGLENVDGSIVFHAGVKKENDEFLTNGGRVLALTSFGNDIEAALRTSLTNAAKVDFEGKVYRGDIGRDLL